MRKQPKLGAQGNIVNPELFVCNSIVLCCLVAQSCLIFAIPWTVTCQASLSVGFCRQEYWSGLPFPPPQYLPDPGIKPASPELTGELSTLSYLGMPCNSIVVLKFLFRVHNVMISCTYTFWNEVYSYTHHLTLIVNLLFAMKYLISCLILYTWNSKFHIIYLK